MPSPTGLREAVGLTEEIQAKKLLKEVMIELIRKRQDFFLEVILEAIEEIGLAVAIREGRQNEFVTEEEIKTILDRPELS